MASLMATEKDSIQSQSPSPSPASANEAPFHTSPYLAHLSPHSPSRRVLVTGGSGFLGRHLIQTLLGLGLEVRCFDIVAIGHDARVTVFQGDLTLEADEELLIEACAEVDTVFHTASLTDPSAEYDAIRRVNVDGSARVLKACLATGVRNLIYTSTTSVIFAGHDIEGLSEDECPYPRRYLDPYSQTKAEAEKLLIAANGTVNSQGQKICTVSLRPHAIFGPRDTHFIAELISRARSGEITHMIGSGQNRVDFTYIGNVIHSMIITMHQLSDPTVPLDCDLSAEHQAARERIGGQCYFVTNGEPRPFWQFINTMLNEVGCVGPTKKISFSIAYFIAFIMECFQWLMKRLPKWFKLNIQASITRHMVCVLGKSQWYSCKKAQRELGYYPIVSIDQGLETTINYFFRRKNVKHWNQQSIGGSGHSSSSSHTHSHSHATHSSSSHSHHPSPNMVVPAPMKPMTRIHSTLMPNTNAPGNDANEGHHLQSTQLHGHSPAVSSMSTHLRPLPHPSLQLPFDASAPSYLPHTPPWPQRHWSTSPPLDERYGYGVNYGNGPSLASSGAAGGYSPARHRHNTTNHMGSHPTHHYQHPSQLQHPSYQSHLYPHPSHPSSHGHLLQPPLPSHPSSLRSMKQIPSVMFLNAYSQPQLTAANVSLSSPFSSPPTYSQSAPNYPTPSPNSSATPTSINAEPTNGETNGTNNQRA